MDFVTKSTVLPTKKRGGCKTKPHVRQPKMYLDRSRICCICGNNRTNDRLINHVLWHRDIDEQGKWTGRYKCNKCYQKEYSRKRVQETALGRQKLIEERDAEVEKLEKEEIKIGDK